MNPTMPIDDAPVEETNEPSTNNQEVVDSSYNFGTASRRYNSIQPQTIEDSSLEVQRPVMQKRMRDEIEEKPSLGESSSQVISFTQNPNQEQKPEASEALRQNLKRPSNSDDVASVPRPSQKAKQEDTDQNTTGEGTERAHLNIEGSSVAEVPRPVMPERADRPNISAGLAWVAEAIANAEVRVTLANGQGAPITIGRFQNSTLSRHQVVSRDDQGVQTLPYSVNSSTQSEAAAPSAAPQMPPPPLTPAASTRWPEEYDEFLSLTIQHQEMMERGPCGFCLSARCTRECVPPMPPGPPPLNSAASMNQWREEYAAFLRRHDEYQLRINRHIDSLPEAERPPPNRFLRRGMEDCREARASHPRGEDN